MGLEDLRKIHVEFCKYCEQINGKKDVDECFNCHWHKLFNVISEELS